MGTYCCKTNDNIEKEKELNMSDRVTKNQSQIAGIDTINTINDDIQLPPNMLTTQTFPMMNNFKENLEIDLENNALGINRGLYTEQNNTDSSIIEYDPKTTRNTVIASPMKEFSLSKISLTKPPSDKPVTDSLAKEELKTQEPKIVKKKKKNTKRESKESVEDSFDRKKTWTSSDKSLDKIEKPEVKAIVSESGVSGNGTLRRSINTIESETDKERGTLEYKFPPETFNYFELLNRHPEKKEFEISLSQLRSGIEKISFKIELNNLHPNYHRDQIFQVEILFTTTDNIEDFFTIGNTHRYRPSDDLAVRFPEEFEINYLFERIQFLRIIIYTNDCVTSEVSINIAQVISQKLSNCIIPIDLINGECILYSENKTDTSKQEVEVLFKRVTQLNEKITPCIFLEFQFLVDISTQGLYYEVLTKNKEGQVNLFFKSNTVKGKGPYNFIVVPIEKDNVFLNPNIDLYCFEFYEEDIYLGQIVIEKNEMDELIDSSTPIPYMVSNEGSQFNTIKKSHYSSQKNLLRYTPSPVPAISSSKKKASKNSGKLLKKGSLSSNKKEEKSSKEVRDISIDGRDSKDKDLKSVEGENEDEESDDEEDGSYEIKRYKTQLPPAHQIGKANIFYQDIKSKRFLDYLLKGLEIYFPIAIDFSSPAKHKVISDKNRYTKILKSFTKIMKDYAVNKRFPVFGFGGMPKALGGGKELKNPNTFFNLSQSKDANIEGIEDLLEKYDLCVRDLSKGGSCNISQVLKEVISMAKYNKKCYEGLAYYSILIISNGSIEDIKDTINAIIEASKLPISIMIVDVKEGLNSSEASRLYPLADRELESSSALKEKVFRKMVQVEALEEYLSEDSLTEKALSKIQEQMMEYFKLRGL